MAENQNVDLEAEENTGVPTDEAILAFEDRIKREVVDINALVSTRIPVLTLKDEYEEDSIFRKKLDDLHTKFPFVRKTRGDGNCFFRAFGFAYMEKLLGDKEELHRFKGIIERSKGQLLALGFPAFTLLDFYEAVMDVINQIEETPSLSELELAYNEQSLSDYIVVYLRLLTSAQLQKDSEFYQHFLEGYATVKEFCGQEVEPMYKESDHIHVIALTKSLLVGVRIVYLDQGEGETANHHDFLEGSSPQVVLLYRPGHYDILYSD